MFFALRYESDPALSDIQNGGVCLHVVALGQWKRGREGGRQGKTDRDGGSGGVQGRVSHCRKA